MTRKSLSIFAVLLALSGSIGWGLWKQAALQEEMVVQQPEAVPPPSVGGAVAAGPRDARPVAGKVDATHFALDDIVAVWGAAGPAVEHSAEEALLLERIFIDDLPAPRVPARELVQAWEKNGAATREENLELIAALSFCGPRMGSERPDVEAEEYQQHCAGLEAQDYLLSREAARQLIGQGSAAARLLYVAIGPLGGGRGDSGEEVVSELGEEEVRVWVQEAQTFLLEYALEGTGDAPLAYSLLAAMHMDTGSEMFSQMHDPELMYAYLYLASAALLANPPDAPDVSAFLFQDPEDLLGILQEMEQEQLTPEQVVNARQRAREIAGLL